MYFNDDTIVFYKYAFLKAFDCAMNPYSQTLHYGNGVFEGLRSYQTTEGPRIFKAKEHFERLINSCRLMGIPFQSSVEEVIDLSYQLLQHNGLTDAYIRPVVISDPNMSLSQPPGSLLFIAAWQWSYFGEELLRLKTASFCRPHPRSVKIDAKACGYYVNSILASQEARTQGFDEALLLDHEGYLAEGPGANLFFEKDGRLFTPAKGSILPGITRDTIIHLCKRLRIPVECGKYTLPDLQAADSAFYCGTGAEISGIGSIDGKVFLKPWKESLGMEIKEAYHKLVRQEAFQPSITII
jgi:branched-chain amino acid aminotransferase